MSRGFRPDSVLTVPSIQIAQLSTCHDRRAFDCGAPELDNFLVRYASRNARKGLSVTYVATAPGRPAVHGFYSLSAGEMVRADLPDDEARRLARYPVPVVRLGRLATHLDVRGEGIGALLLIDALRKALRLADELGTYAVELDAKSSSARSFYEKYGFKALADDKLHLYIPIQTIRRLFRP